AFGIMSEVVSRAPDSFSSFLVSTMQGSTETTFYVLAVYFGAVGVVRTRHAVAAALLADITGIIMALAMCHMMF
ncbi:MAG: spore maturation protein, partial [Deltaproteobacteria bacterium]|nr:spore maturation protein [Deltaproteobacteria bacterium]